MVSLVGRNATVDSFKKSGIDSKVEVGSLSMFIPLFYNIVYIPGGWPLVGLGISKNHQQYELQYEPGNLPSIAKMGFLKGVNQPSLLKVNNWHPLEGACMYTGMSMVLSNWIITPIYK